MYKKFHLSSIEQLVAEKRIDLKFNFDIDEQSVKVDRINLVTSNGDHVEFKPVVDGDVISLFLDRWPLPNETYQIIIEKEIKNISGSYLESSIRRKIVFKSEITSIVSIKNPYNFQKIEQFDFEITDSENYNSYYVEIAKENRFYNLLYSGSVYTNNLNLLFPEEPSKGQYYIRARIQDGTEYSKWSDVTTFIYKDVCNCNYPQEDGPSADTEMPSAWDNIYNNINENPYINANIPTIEIEDDLEIVSGPTNGITPKTFFFEFDRDLDIESGEIIVIKREF
jgi:hypothetical protein